jgi:glyceraldehyde 3-phosphate dehydrogenase
MNILLNGVGRIGKAILRLANSSKSLKIVAINELNQNIENIAYLINYDSTYGKIDDKFYVEDNYIYNTKNKIEVLNEKDITKINFKTRQIDCIIDASGSAVDSAKLKSLDLKRIFLTHPSSSADINVVLGVNEEQLNNTHKVISTSSCNATALLPLLKIIDDNFSIKYGDIVTIHPLLNHQKALDSSCIGSKNRDIKCNFEFGRSSTQNIIPSRTTTIDACSYIVPHINENLISSSSLRVPTPTVGAINISLTVKKECSVKKLQKLLLKYEKKQKSKIVLNSFEPFVSSDFQSEEYTTIIDHRFTDVKKNKMIKLVIWYDNEWGYASKVVSIVKKIIIPF